MGGGGFPYKIVIGEPIAYKARKGTGTGWHWDLGDWNAGTFTPYWSGLSPLTPTSYMDDGMALIPGTVVNMPVSNNDLGPAHGLIRVTDGVSTTYSKNVLNLPTGDYKGPEIDVSVFYKKDDNLFTQTHPLYITPQGNPIIADVPNWFYYWKQFIPQTFLALPGIKLFNSSSCQFETMSTVATLDIVYGHIPYINVYQNVNYTLEYDYSALPGATNTYGANRFSVTSNNAIEIGPGNPTCPNYSQATTVITDYNEEFHHCLIGKGCGFRKADPRDPSQQTNILGLHVFLSTIVHEHEHAVIECEVWTDGYSSHLDGDNDGYNDIWEMANQQLGFNFMNPADKYNPKYRINNGVIEELINGAWVPGSAGTVYEETRCRDKEKDFLNNMQNMYDAFDWSYDPSNLNQGKQYKN